MNFLTKVADYFKGIKNWPKSKMFNAFSWLVAGILLVVLIALLVAFSSTMGVTAGTPAVLVASAVIQQNIIAGIALGFLVFLALAIFSLVISILMKKKKVK